MCSSDLSLAPIKFQFSNCNEFLCSVPESFPRHFVVSLGKPVAVNQGASKTLARKFLLQIFPICHGRFGVCYGCVVCLKEMQILSISALGLVTVAVGSILSGVIVNNTAIQLRQVDDSTVEKKQQKIGRSDCQPPLN